MAKRSKTTATSKPVKRSLDTESIPYFTPAAFAVILIGLVILFREFIFSDRMLYGSDMIQAGVFFRSLLIDYFLENGSVPQWNPYIFGGMPYVDAFHGDIFYPLSTLKYVWSIYRILGLNLFFHIFLAGIFMYLAARIADFIFSKKFNLFLLAPMPQRGPKNTVPAHETESCVISGIFQGLFYLRGSRGRDFFISSHLEDPFA